MERGGELGQVAEGAASVIYARTDVRMPTHRRFIAAGPAAVGYWAAANCYSRGEELDGELPAEAIGVLLALGETRGRKLAEKLVAVGLFERLGDGYMILKYAEHNETKAQIGVRRIATKARVGAHRNKACNGVTPTVTNTVSNASVPGSDSVSDLRDRDQGSLTPPPADIPITDEMRDECVMAGAKSPERGDVVLCLANARKKGHVRADWAAELVTWMVRGKQFDRPSGVLRVAPEANDSPPEGRTDIHNGKRYRVVNGVRVEVSASETG